VAERSSGRFLTGLEKGHTLNYSIHYICELKTVSKGVNIANLSRFAKFKNQEPKKGAFFYLGFVLKKCSGFVCFPQNV
jgi:hypothetical protein